VASAQQSEDDRRALILQKLAANPVLCHAVLYAERHKQKTPPFHLEIIKRWWSPARRAGVKAFRGGAKSTLAEEATASQALLGRFKYGVLLGASYGLACQRLAKVKHEIRTNVAIDQLFGNQEGETWNEGEVVLKSGTMIQAVGAGQSLRGLKHLDYRPDFVMIDDLEDYGERVPDVHKDIEPIMDWLIGGFIPACDPEARIRILGTPLHPKSVIEQLADDPDWEFSTYPIVTPATTDFGDDCVSNWPDRFPVETVRKIFESMQRLGRAHSFVQEYLCQSESQALKPFQPRHIVQAPQVPDWAPSVLVVDPARTVNTTTSARTGYCVFSWVGAKCYVRAAYGAFHKPSEIVDEIFKLDELFRLVWVRPEKDGLAEFLLQPIRSRMLETGRVLPLLPVSAPRDRDKNSFINGLQPFFEAGDILLCGDLPDLAGELLAFPSGRKDVLNALAYAPRSRPGAPVYPDFAFHHVAPASLTPSLMQPIYLCLSARGGHLTGVLAQYLNGAVRVFADWVREGPPSDTLESVVTEATLIAGRQPTVMAPLKQFDRYTNVGLPGALTQLRLKAQQGPSDKQGSLEPFLRKLSQHQPAFLVGMNARWTINALAAGYARALDKSGVLQPHPDEGYYQTLMEGLESFVAWLTVEAAIGDTGPINWQHTNDGRRYISARATGGQQASQELKLAGSGTIRIPGRLA
jgi:hypothetical protein